MHYRSKGSIKLSCLIIKPFPPPSMQVQRDRKSQGHSYNWHITDRAYWKCTTCKVLTCAYSRLHLHYQYAYPFAPKCFLVLIYNQFFLLMMFLPYFLRTLNLFFYRLAYIFYNIDDLHFLEFCTNEIMLHTLMCCLAFSQNDAMKTDFGLCISS